jgi:hypothetical protein
MVRFIADDGPLTGFLQTIGYASSCMLLDSVMEFHLLFVMIAPLGKFVK